VDVDSDVDRHRGPPSRARMSPETTFTGLSREGVRPTPGPIGSGQSGCGGQRRTPSGPPVCDVPRDIRGIGKRRGL
jgi:hypothetical protein